MCTLEMDCLIAWLRAFRVTVVHAWNNYSTYYPVSIRELTGTCLLRRRPFPCVLSHDQNQTSSAKRRRTVDEMHIHVYVHANRVFQTE
jgi:hypothetical protein